MIVDKKSGEQVAMKFDRKKLKWTREPSDFTIADNQIEIITDPHTDLWQRTYYHFRNDKWLAHDGQQPDGCK